MSPAAHWTLATGLGARKGLLAWLFVSSTQEYKRLRQTKTQVRVTVRGFLCSPTWKTEASCPIRITAVLQKQPEAVGVGMAHHILHFYFAKCAHRMITFAFLACFSCYNKKIQNSSGLNKVEVYSLSSSDPGVARVREVKTLCHFQCVRLSSRGLVQILLPHLHPRQQEAGNDVQSSHSCPTKA